MHWLAGQPGKSQREHSSAADLSINGQIAIDAQGRLRAPVMRFVDRSNLQTEIAFGTVRKFATVAEAETFATDYDRTMPRNGILVFECVLPDGETERRYMAGAVVQPPDREAVGVSVILRYRVLGGMIGDQEDGTGENWEDDSGNWED